MYLLFDIGGTSIRLALSKDGQSLDNQTTIPTLKDFNQAMTNFQQTVLNLSAGEKFLAACGAVRALDKSKTKLVPHPLVPLWENEPLKQRLEEILQTKVYLENDAGLAGLGEACFGAGKGKDIVVFLTISTGIGGVRITNQKIDESFLGFEPGNQIIDLTGPTTWEGLVSGQALLNKFAKKAEEITDPQVWDEVARNLAIGLNNVLVFWSPEIIILGGSVMKSINLEKVRSYLREVCKIYPELPPIEPASLGEKAALFGGLAYLKSKANLN